MAMKRKLLNNIASWLYLSYFPEDKKHTRSVEACRSHKPNLLIFHVPCGIIFISKTILIHHLKGNLEEDKAFFHYIIKIG